MSEDHQQTVAGLGGKVVDSLKSSPTLLALVVLNLFMVGGILWSVREERVLRADVTKSEQEIIGDMAKMLAADCGPR